MNFRSTLLKSLRVFFSFLILIGDSFAGELDDIRREVRTVQAASSSESPTQPAPNGSSSECDSAAPSRSPRKPRQAQSFLDDDNDVESELTTLAVTVAFWGTAAVVTSPFWVPHKLLRDDLDAITGFRVDPYANEDWGFLLIDRPDSLRLSSFAGSLSVDYGGDFNDLAAFGIDGTMEHATRWGADARVRHFRESIPIGDDRLTIGAANLTYRFAQSPRLAFRSGLGVNWLHDQAATDLGINWIYSAQWCVANPLVLRSDLELGSLGDAFTSHTLIRMGVQRGRWQAYIGGETFHFNSQTTCLATTGLSLRF